MALKYSFKLFFLNCFFEFMIKTAPQGSNSVNGREKYFKIIIKVRIGQWSHGPGSWGAVQIPAGLLAFFFAFFSLSSYFYLLACFRLFSLLTLFSFARFLR